VPEPSATSRILAIGDIHGCDTALDVLLEHVQPASDDLLVILGDVVDRGPGSSRVIERLLQLREVCRLVFILGNHEEMMLDALSGGRWSSSWPIHGGRATLQSYGGDREQIPPGHLAFLRGGLPYFETGSTIFVHANLLPWVPLDQQAGNWLRWTHLSGSEQPHPSGKRVICGHTPQRSGHPLAFPGWVCIDTLACAGGWLTCMNVGSDEIWQTNQLGEYRTGWVLG